MPQAQDLVIKNYAAVDKTFTLLSPAAGDNSLASWALKEGTISSVFPKITALARPTGNKSRRVQIKFKLPSSYTDTVTGLTKVSSAFECDVYASVPDDFPEALKNDAVAFTCNMVNAAMVKAMIRDGLSAT